MCATGFETTHRQSYLFVIELKYIRWKRFSWTTLTVLTTAIACTGKSFSEALILESVNPQYDESVHWIPRKIHLHNMLCTNIVLNVKTKKQFLYTTCCELEQSLVILWVNWCKNEGFWKRFTCIVVTKSPAPLCYQLENERLSFPRASYLQHQNKNELPDTFVILFGWINCNK